MVHFFFNFQTLNKQSKNIKNTTVPLTINPYSVSFFTVTSKTSKGDKSCSSGQAAKET